MTDTITKIRVLADDFADSGRTYEGCDVARALNGFADRCEATNPTRSGESELRGSVTIEEKEDGDWLLFSPPEGASAMVLLDGIGGPIIQRSIRATLADHQIDSERDARAEREKLQFLNPAGLHYHQGSGRLSFNGVGFKGACIDVGDMNGRTEDLVTDLIERTEVAVASAWSAGYDSGQKRLANPTRSDESELRSAAEEVVAADRGGLTLGARASNNNYERMDCALDNLATALSKTPEAAQPIPEAKSHDYPLFDLDRALGIVERVKAFVDGDIDPQLASVSTVLADLDNLSLCLKLAAGEVDNPPPAATGEGSQSVSEGADARVAVSDWARAVGPAVADRYLAGDTASDVADDFDVGHWTSEQVVEALAAVELNVRDDAPEGAESSRGGDGPYAMGDITPSRFPITRTLSHREASIANAAYVEGYGEFVANFAETYIIQSKGRWAGKPIVLEEWQHDSNLLKGESNE